MRRIGLVLALALLPLVDACAGDEGATDSPTTTVPVAEVVDGEPFPADRCAANRAAGTITYLSGFDLASTASIVDVVVAEAAGHYDELCLDVEVLPSYSADNYPLVAAEEAQFASAGSFGEMVNFAGPNDAGFVAVAVDGRIGLDTLVVIDPSVDELEDLRGRTIGVQGALTPAVKTMLHDAGLVEEVDFTTEQLEGFDPVEHAAVDGIVGFPAYRSKELLRLDDAGVEFRVFDPADLDVPGSFGVLYTSRAFLDQHPTAVEDFVRATFRGLADAVGDPEAAARTLEIARSANGNPLDLDDGVEAERWTVESGLLRSDDTAPLGVPLPDLLHDEVQAYAQTGLFDGVEPLVDDLLDAGIAAGLHAADGRLIWPATG